MEYLAYIVVGLVPALAVIIAVYIVQRENKDKELSHLSLQLKGDRQKLFVEPRMEAYQRIILLLERITPHNLIMRLHHSNKAASLFQQDLLNNIRTEFDHNVAQQLFIPINIWDYVKKSKEETIKIINTAAGQLDEHATSIDLANKIFEIAGELEELPTEIAIKILKDDFQRMF
ncbi:MAG: hypothetical protein H3C31_09240 [Brumimicrobium sp.]|nr:hypothetical protein [Brumimicrobium sp.]MCO5269984.1 hypothetical protein [Brumimicrobium sp.]